MSTGGWIFLIVVVAIAFAIAMYTGLVTLRNPYKNAYAQIDVQLKRRYDLIANVVEEMAIASGIHVPPVHVLEKERSINVFSAGGVRYHRLEELAGDARVLLSVMAHAAGGDAALAFAKAATALGLNLREPLPVAELASVRASPLRSSGCGGLRRWPSRA